MLQINDNIKQSRTILYYIPGVDWLVDGLTKALLKDAYKVFKIGIRVTKFSQVTQV